MQTAVCTVHTHRNETRAFSSSASQCLIIKPSYKTLIQKSALNDLFLTVIGYDKTLMKSDDFLSIEAYLSLRKKLYFCTFFFLSKINVTINVLNGKYSVVVHLTRCLCHANFFPSHTVRKNVFDLRKWSWDHAQVAHFPLYPSSFLSSFTLQTIFIKVSKQIVSMADVTHVHYIYLSNAARLKICA